MKLHCPRCEKKLSIPDKFAGKAIRCPACNRAFNVPKPQVALSGPGGAAVDLENLAALERGSTQMGEEELAGAKMANHAKAKAKPGERTCSQCGKITEVQDIYVETLCSHCWTPIPGISVGDGYDVGDTKLVGYKGSTAQGSVTFYNGLATAMAYPVQAIGSLLVAVLVAIAIILLPVAMMTAVGSAAEQSASGTIAGVQKADLTGVQLMLRGVFLVEVLFFSAVGIHALMDVIRTTAVGEEKPPSLSWHPNNWGKSLVGYVALLVYYAVMTYVVLFIANGGTVVIPYSVNEAQATFSNPNVIVGMVIISFVVPMNLIGLALGEVSQALNPVNVLKSIGKTHVHYLFLVIMLCVYGTICAAAFLGILQWFLPKVDAMAVGAGEGQLGAVALGLLAWGLVMGFVFYSMYALGRLHGLFARTYRKHLLFGERYTAMPDLAKDGVTIQTFDELYRGGTAAWEVGHPQPEVVALADGGFFSGRVLDIGSGTGENALMLAGRGLDVFGIDQIEAAIQQARDKATQRQLAVQFKVHDALNLAALGGTFDTVLDSAVFHGFSDAERPRYAYSVASVLRPGGRMAMICFSEVENREGGPRRVTQQEIRDTFSAGWAIDEIRPIRYQATIFADGARCWLTLMRRT